MLSYSFLFHLALILLSTKLMGLLTKKIRLPQVVGALLAGLILGPSVLNILNETEFILQLAELGVIVLMFTAGVEADIKQLRKVGRSSLGISALGIIIPLIGGYLLSVFINRGTDTSLTIEHFFMGLIVASTSVSITVETLKELGKLSTTAGNAILGASIMDDIICIIALSVITSMREPGVSLGMALLKLVLFFVVAGVAGYLFSRFINHLMEQYDMDLRRFVVLSFVFCLLLSYCAEEFFGVEAITGAFLAGLSLSTAPRKHYVETRFETTAYMLLSPVFFASIGIKVIIPEITLNLVLLSSALVSIAILGKLIGSGVAAKLAGYSNREALQIGSGMICRGEVTLIIASKGIALGLLQPVFFGPIVIMVIITAMFMPILLKLVFTEKKPVAN